MAKIDPEFEEWLAKEKIKYSLGSRFLIRFHVFLILAVAVLAGWAANRALYASGLGNMLIRHPLALGASYLGFLGGLRLWVHYSGIKEYVDHRKAIDLLEPAGFKLQGQSPPAAKQPSTGNSAWDLFWVSPEVWVFLVIVLAVVALSSIGGYMIAYGANVVAEVVFELLLAAGLIKGIRRVDSTAYAGWFPATSLWALLAAMGISVLFALFAYAFYPKATTIFEVIYAIFHHGALR